MSLTAAQLQLRKTGIGASEIGSIVGAVGAYDPPLSIWAKKVGLIGDADETETPEYVELGNLLEPVIASLYARRTGYELYEPGTMVHPKNPLQIATPDRLVRGEARGAQIKKARSMGTWGLEGTDDVPENIICQVQWEMSVADLEVEDVPVLFWGSHLSVYTVRRDDELIGGIVEIASKWWRDHVVAKKAPPPDGSERTREALAKICGANNGKVVSLTPTQGSDAQAVVAFAVDYDQAREQEKTAKARKDLAGNNLRQLIGNLDGYVWPGGQVTWKRDSTGKPSWKSIAEELKAPASVIAKHTGDPDRTLRVKFKGDK